MRELFRFFVHLLAAVAKYTRPGGAKAVIAESLLLKHQLLVINRSRRRAPKLTPFDRALMGLCSLLMNPARIHKSAIILKPATLLKFHDALKTRKYRLLFSSQRRGKPGPKGPSQELIQAIVEMKRRNTWFGCPRIAQ